MIEEAIRIPIEVPKRRFGDLWKNTAVVTMMRTLQPDMERHLVGLLSLVEHPLLMQALHPIPSPDSF